MKTFKKTIVAMSMLTIACMLIIACSRDNAMEEWNINTSTEKRIPHYATMQLDGSITPFDATRSTTATWEHEDKIYLQFTVGTSIVDGIATYDATTQKWNVQYHGTIITGVETKCEAYYFENAGNDDDTRIIIHLNENCAIYLDKSATYLFEDGMLKVTASLTPMTGRIRFKGEGTESYRFSGISYYNTYNITTNSFTTAELNMHSSQTSTDGYSNYYYGFFPDESNKYMCFDDYDNCVSYSRLLGEQALAIGRSGYLNIPTFSNSNGWNHLTFKDFTVSNVKFRMIRVITKDSYYYVGESEVTQELWKAIKGTNPSTFTGVNMPVETITYSEYQDFILKLNAKTGEKFYIPSETEWTFAAKGAGASKSYAYSGSKNINDVAWYNDNSNGSTHPVKSKLPNEIGIYDMSGNVSEWTNYNYSSGYYYYGGSWNNKATNTSSKVSYSKSASSAIGIRLFLKD